jgi:proline iminopeptidase
MDTPSTHAWQAMYPPLQCHAHGWLPVGDGHDMYWESSGHPLGLPALFVHGGPGAGGKLDDRRWFDPARYRIVAFDQRGSGRSRPLGRIVANATDDLIDDMERLRVQLDIERWLLFGGSWGATLALAYAQRHPQRVASLVLRGVFLATRRECDWLYCAHGAAATNPVGWSRLLSTQSDTGQTGLLARFNAQLHCGDGAIELATGRAWLTWEQNLMERETGAPVRAAADDDAPDAGRALAMARIGVHYAMHDFFLQEGQLLANAATLTGVPGVIVQGTRDGVTPPAAAQALHRAWPASRLHCIEDAGHSSSHPQVAEQLIAATDFFATGDMHERFRSAS